MHSNDIIGDTWALKASMNILMYLLADDDRHKARVHQLAFIGAFLQYNVKNRVFVSCTVDMDYTSPSMLTISKTTEAE